MLKPEVIPAEENIPPDPDQAIYFNSTIGKGTTFWIYVQGEVEG